MVSFQPLFPKQLNQRKMIADHDLDESEMIKSISKKRKYDDFEADQVDHKPCNNPWPTTTKSSIFDDIELHQETPLPSEWQRCLDIQSGEIHFYNTRTQKRTVKDPRKESSPIIQEASSPEGSYMSLDLELNLPCHPSYTNYSSSPTSERTSNPTTTTPKTKKPSSNPLMMSLTTKQTTYFEAAADEEEVEMVATACMKCHMLVMLCKSSPTCPNCKFVHPPYQTPSELFKPRLSLSC